MVAKKVIDFKKNAVLVTRMKDNGKGCPADFRTLEKVELSAYFNKTIILETVKIIVKEKKVKVDKDDGSFKWETKLNADGSIMFVPTVFMSFDGDKYAVTNYNRLIDLIAVSSDTVIDITKAGEYDLTDIYKGMKVKIIQTMEKYNDGKEYPKPMFDNPDE